MMMMVELPTVAQASRVATATGGAHLVSSVTGKLSRRVDVGHDFEVHRDAVEAVSALFTLYRREDDGALVKAPSGWLTTGATFEVAWPDEPERRSLIRSHFGARRKAFNWAPGRVIADIEAHRDDPDHKGVSWALPGLRKEWNQVKDEVAPWWAVNSKECWSTGITMPPRTSATGRSKTSLVAQLEPPPQRTPDQRLLAQTLARTTGTPVAGGATVGTARKGGRVAVRRELIPVVKTG